MGWDVYYNCREFPFFKHPQNIKAPPVIIVLAHRLFLRAQIALPWSEALSPTAEPIIKWLSIPAAAPSNEFQHKLRPVNPEPCQAIPGHSVKTRFLTRHCVAGDKIHVWLGGVNYPKSAINQLVLCRPHVTTTTSVSISLASILSLKCVLGVDW